MESSQVGKQITSSARLTSNFATARILVASQV